MFDRYGCKVIGGRWVEELKQNREVLGSLERIGGDLGRSNWWSSAFLFQFSSKLFFRNQRVFWNCDEREVGKDWRKANMQRQYFSHVYGANQPGDERGGKGKKKKRKIGKINKTDGWKILCSPTTRPPSQHLSASVPSPPAAASPFNSVRCNQGVGAQFARNQVKGSS